MGAWQSDNGDGTFTNPPLYADYPDPDIIRVGEDFYFATTTFVNSPGLTILHSQDLVNWEIASHVMPRLEGRGEYDMKGGTAYRGGVLAPSLRHHDGTFYVVVTPGGQRTHVYRSEDVRGPWRSNEIDRSAWDPGLFIEADGTGYIATSGCWDGHVTMMRLDPGYTRVLEERMVLFNKGGEGSKIVKRGGWYYMFHSVPSRLALTCSRARSIWGPYETVAQIDDRTGGHQGAIVDLPDGGWYGFAMKDCGAVGRMTNIGPVFWRYDWPVWGTPEAPGRIPAAARKPIQGKPARQPASSDDFDAPALGPQWQWNHNPEDSRWSLAERRGFLRLRPTKATAFWTARNTLTQKGQGPRSRGEVDLDIWRLGPGDVCGFGTLGKVNGHIAVTRGGDGKTSLSMNVIVAEGESETRVAAEPIRASSIFLRTDMDFERNRGLCSYSLDGRRWTPLGGEFDLAFDWRTGTFQGEQFAIFCFNPDPGDGFVDVDAFRLSGIDRPDEGTTGR